MNSSFAVFASGCLLGAGTTLICFLLADVLANWFHEEAKRSSRRIRGATSALVLGLAWISSVMGLDKSSVMLLMLIAVILCAKVGGFVDVLGLSAFSVALLAYYFLPPVRSWEVADPKDKISLAIFIGTALLAGRLIGERGRPKLSSNSVGASNN